MAESSESVIEALKMADVVEIEPSNKIDGGLWLREACDGYFEIHLTAEESRQLISELTEMLQEQ